MSGPYCYKNLAVFLVHGEDRIEDQNVLSLQEGIQRKLVVVHETGDVGQLEIENASDQVIYIQAGCIVKGGQQDRVINADYILEPNSGRRPLPTFCVEQGRWTGRPNQSAQSFEVAPNAVADKDIKLAIKVGRSQGQVWQRVDSLESKLSATIRGGRAADASSPTSLPLMLENDEVVGSAGAYFTSISVQIQNSPDAMGLAFAINNEINSADIYGNSDLFQQFLPELLRSAANEAVAKSKEVGRSAVVDTDAVSDWLRRADNALETRSEIVENVYIVTSETDSTVTIESYKYGPGPNWLHKSVLAK
jgi:hypothetical protein